MVLGRAFDVAICCTLSRDPRQQVQVPVVYLVTQLALPLPVRRLHLAVFTLRLYFRLCRVYLGEMYFTNYYVSALLRALCNEIKALPALTSLN